MKDRPNPGNVNPYDSKALKRTRPKKRKRKPLNPYKSDDRRI